MFSRAAPKNAGKFVVVVLYPIPVRIAPSERLGYLAMKECVRKDPYECPMWTIFEGWPMVPVYWPCFSEVVREARIASAFAD